MPASVSIRCDHVRSPRRSTVLGDDQTTRRRLAPRRRARRDFTWARTADLTVEAYRAIAAMKRARCGVNLLWLVPGVVGGTEEYAAAPAARRWPIRDDDLELVLFALRSVRCRVPRRCAARSHDDRRAARRPNRALRGRGREHVARRASCGAALDVVHHLGGRVPPSARPPSVVTVHDLQPLHFPANFSAVKRRFLACSCPPIGAQAAAGRDRSASGSAGRSSTRWHIPEERIGA